MPDYAPWLRPADPNRSQTAGSEAGARLRSIREQAAASLRNHQAAMAAISQRGVSQAQEARMQDRALQSRERAQAQELEMAASKLREDSRQADLMAAFNEKKLAAESGAARYINTAGGLIKLNPDGSEVLVPGTQKAAEGAGGVAQFLEGGNTPTTGTTPAGSTPAPGGLPSFKGSTAAKGDKNGLVSQIGDLVRFFTPTVNTGSTFASSLPGMPNPRTTRTAPAKAGGRNWIFENGKLIQEK